MFVQADAIAYIREHGHEFDAIAAAPPCQRYSSMAGRHADREYPDLIPPTREALREVADPAGIPWVIENVPGAPLYGALELCGTHFGLRAVCRDGVERWLRRHRRFEFSPNVWIMAPGGCHCHGRPIGGVYGTGGGGPMTRGYKFHAAEARQAMGIDWMTLPALAQAIPPAYGEYIGDALMETVKAGV
ncbi:DNA cytosine methyltransferase [Actinomadura macrotermitis]|uniref:DNA cytosine methyltransferase n=1 Tax=Actinomadura macrotermitis TaxID=2585200 RepID=UPI001A9BC94A|nr:DNA cytosine methyltransferase [Actinomadura macrotermitis]